jgi:hypothetical protein
VVLNSLIDRIYFGGRIKSFPETVTESSKALFIHGDAEALPYATKLRSLV